MGRPKTELTSFRDETLDLVAERIQAATRITFPCVRYQQDPVAFCREILGVDPWERQIELMEALTTHSRVAYRSGHRVGKSGAVGMLALWNYCSFEASRTILTSTTARQVDGILWYEIQKLKRNSGVCLDCKRAQYDGPKPCPHSAVIDGEMGELARTGLKADDGREIKGFTARDAEAIQGIAGRNLLFIADEASGIADAIFEGISGNLAGGGRLVLTGNPTRNEGEFYRAFHEKRDLYYRMTVSSAESPNVRAGKVLIEGLATREWLEQRKIEWGEKSGIYKVRVLGEHALHEDGRIFSIHAISEAQGRHADTEADGRLYVGLDPAGASGKGDDSAFAPRRGLKVLYLEAYKGLDADAHLVHLLAILARERVPREVPVVVMDREGAVGAELYGKLRDYVTRNPSAFVLSGIRASDKAVRQPEVYDRMRDGLCANLEGFVREGGALPPDEKLAAELHVLEYKTQAGSGRLKVTPKEQVRKVLGRSPDRYDAVALACWEPLAARDDEAASVQQVADPAARVPTLDPYAGSRAWGRR